MSDILATIPLVAPPPGVKSNFVNPSSTGNVVTITASIFLGFQIVFYGLRIYTRAFVAHKFRWDDLTCTIGFLFSIGFYVLCILSVKTSYNGVNEWNVSVLQIINCNIFLACLGILEQFFYPIGVGFIKLTFFLFFWEIFQSLTWARIAIWFGAGFSTVFYTVSLALHAYFSIPEKGQTFLTHALTHQEHQDLTLSVPSAAISVVIDLYILVLPLIGIWTVRLNVKRKLGVSIIFLTGLMACVSSILLLYYRVILFRTADYLGNLPAVLTTSCLELQIGTVCACMPVLPLLARKIWHKPKKPMTRAPYSSSWRSRKTPGRRRQDEYTTDVDDMSRDNTSQLELTARGTGNHSTVQTQIGNGDIPEAYTSGDNRIHLTHVIQQRSDPDLEFGFEDH